MALLFVDGFDHYATADITKKWNLSNGSVTISASNGRRGTGSFRFTSSNQYLQKSFAAAASLVVGFAFTLGTFPSGAVPIVTFRDSTSVQCDLRINADGTLSVTRNGTAVTGGTSSYVLPTGQSVYIEFKATIADSISAGSCKVRVNGSDVITVDAGQDLKATTNASADAVRIGHHTVTNAMGTCDIDDFYLCDGSGSTNNDFLGDVRADTSFPDADGNYSQFTPSTGTTHYTLVDESTPNTTDYNDGGTVGDRDSYGFQNLAALASQTVYGVQVNLAVLKDDAGARSVASMARSGATNSDGAAVVLGTSQVYVSQVFETDPNGGAAWTESAVNAAEFGAKVAA